MTKSYVYVGIQSNINIRVTGGLLALDATKQDSDLENRLKVKPIWPKTGVMIIKGLGYYPNCIKDWSTVKALVDKGLMSIAGETDEVGSLGKSDVATKTSEAVDKETRDIKAAFAESNAKIVESPLEKASEEK